MNIEKITKQAFTIIGIEGSTNDGDGFIGKLWDEANSRFSEIMDLCKRDENNNFVGFWGAMSDFSRMFKPWDNFSQGFYLAGAECVDDANPPKGWTKWSIPAFEYLCFDQEEYKFSEAIDYMENNGFNIAGAAHDFTDPLTGKNYIYIPIRKL